MRTPLMLMLLTALLTLLSGCQHIKSQNDLATEQIIVVEKQRQQTLSQWLQEIQDIMSMNQEQLQQQLKDQGVAKPAQANELFSYVLLNQQLKDRLGWIRARDGLRQLKQYPIVSGELQVLIDVLLQHNQAMINADARDSRLHEAFLQSQDQQQKITEALQQSHRQTQELQQKIEALTSLERNMSIRRALTTDAPKEPASE